MRRRQTVVFPTAVACAAAALFVASGLPGAPQRGGQRGSDRQLAGAAEITYHNRISRIIQEKCQGCHRPGGVGPFPMLDYAQVHGRRYMIQWVLAEGIMPPWHADEGSGPWANDFSLAAEELADFLGWIEAGGPEGDPAHGPSPKSWVEGWTIGAPDAVVSIPEPFAVPAAGVVDYQYVYAKTDFPEDRWIKAMEVRPTAREVTHHVLVFIEDPAKRQRLLDARTDEERAVAPREVQGGLQGYFASYAPGQQGLVFADGFAKRLPAGAWLKFQLHYTPNGREVFDQTEIGFVFADEAGLAEVRTSSASDTEFVIPAGAKDFAVSAEYVFEREAALLSLFPHTHLRGTRFLFELIYPEGRLEKVLPISRYDFNWQLNYLFETPKRVPAGTVLRVTGWYDNSAANPSNPDPTRDVRFGEQTDDEMLIGYVNWVPVESGR